MYSSDVDWYSEFSYESYEPPLSMALWDCPRLGSFCGREVTLGKYGQWSGCHMHWNRQSCEGHFIADSQGMESRLCVWNGHYCEADRCSKFNGITSKDGLTCCRKDCGAYCSSKTTVCNAPAGQEGNCCATSIAASGRVCGFGGAQAPCTLDVMSQYTDDVCSLSPYDVQSYCPQIIEIKTTVLVADKDNDGVLTAAEVGNFLRAQGMFPTEMELVEMFAEMDRDGDGRISVDDFLALVLGDLGTDRELKGDGEAAFWETAVCQVGGEIQCPLSGEMCSGNECCPGVKESGGLAFPCPSASSTWCGCSNRTKLQDCTTTVPPMKYIPDTATCSGTCDEFLCADLADESFGWDDVCIQASCSGCPACCRY